MTIVLTSCVTETNTYNGFPVLQANSNLADIKLGGKLYKGVWKINPNVPCDTINVGCVGSKEPFLLKTDVDSIAVEVEGNKTYRFYIHLKDSGYAQAMVKGIPMPKDVIEFDEKVKDSSVVIKYPESSAQYLKDLSEKYPIDLAIEDKKSDIDKILSVLNWTNSRWSHNGNQSPSKSDAITILDEAKEGKSFPCFAYAIVLKSQLENAGFKARTIYLKTKDVETRKGSPGHVATEVYSDELGKWIFIDGQFNLMPVLKSIPLNAVELQKAINTNYEDLLMKSLGNVSKRDYVDFVYDYLYYFDTALDQRYIGDSDASKHTIANKSKLMLVPKGSENPTKIDFWNMVLDNYLYTNSLAEFYAKPI